VSEITPGQVRAFRLARQHLTDPLPAERLAEIVADVGGIQAQVMSAAELALWARSRGLTPGHVREALWERRELVKTWCMRGTLHLLPAFEFGLWASALANRTGWRKRPWLRAFGVTVDEIEALIAAIDANLHETGKTRDEVAQLASPHMREQLLHGWGTFLKPAAYEGVLCFGPNRGRNVTFVRPADWLGGFDEEDAEEALRDVLRRYLRTYGPATHDDFARWWGGGGPTRPARRLLESLGDEIEQVEAEGRQAWVLAGDADVLRSLDPPRSVHLLPNFDLYTLHYRPRERIIPEGVLDRVYRTAGWVSPVVLVNGAVAGVWDQKKRARRVELAVEPFVRLTKAATKGIEREAKRLAEFLGTPVGLQL
jgi:hypothetical protein